MDGEDESRNDVYDDRQEAHVFLRRRRISNAKNQNYSCRNNDDGPLTWREEVTLHCGGDTTDAERRKRSRNTGPSSSCAHTTTIPSERNNLRVRCVLRDRTRLFSFLFFFSFITTATVTEVMCVCGHLSSEDILFIPAVPRGTAGVELCALLGLCAHRFIT